MWMMKEEVMLSKETCLKKLSPGRAGRKGLGFFSSRSAVMLAVETNKISTDTRDTGAGMLEQQSSDLLRVES